MFLHYAMILGMFFLLTGCTQKNPDSRMNTSQVYAEFALGTVCTVNLYDHSSEKVYNDIFSRLFEIENLMSINKADTDVDRINQNAGIKPVQVHQEVIELLEKARDYAELSGGAFDPTVGPLVRLWGIGSADPQIPEQEAIQEALSLINWRDLVIDKEAGTAFLRRSNMMLDLGAIAKGYAADEAAKILSKAGVPGGIIDLGGNIVAYKNKKESNGEYTGFWRIGLQNPLEDRGTYIGILEVQHKSIVTSGIYERYAEINGTRYHHILSTANGYPVDNDLLSVTIIADASMDADALSTAVFALGYEKGRTLIESLDRVEGVFVFADKGIRLTQGAKSMFRLHDAASYCLLTD
ncbi:MAG: FAD:protein FMN transferase [Treponema sp.]|jgi:thiamine biosynthesis lipoprotein|nr:FAD:protein FMN transferase [Treponema sp.]